MDNHLTPVALAEKSPEKVLASAELRGTVLVADDEQAVLGLIRRVLETLGLCVLTANDGQHSVEVFRDHADEIMAVLLDWAMPTMSGIDAFDAIRRIRPDVPVLILSGYSEDETNARLFGKPLAGFIPKPFSPRSLADKLRAILPREAATAGRR